MNFRRKTVSDGVADAAASLAAVVVVVNGRVEYFASPRGSLQNLWNMSQTSCSLQYICKVVDKYLFEERIGPNSMVIWLIDKKIANCFTDG